MFSKFSSSSGSPQPSLNETVAVLRRAVAVCPYGHPIRSSLSELRCILEPFEGGYTCILDSPTTWQSSLKEICDLCIDVLQKCSLNFETFLNISDGNDLSENCKSTDDLNNLHQAARNLFVLLESRGFITAFHPQQRDHYMLHDLTNRIAADTASRVVVFENLREVFATLPNILAFLESLAAPDLPLSLHTIREALSSASKRNLSDTSKQPSSIVDVSHITAAAKAALKLHNSFASIADNADIACCEVIGRLITHIFRDELPLNPSRPDSVLTLASSVDPDDMLAGLASGTPCSLPGSHILSIDGHRLFSTAVTITFFQTPLPNPPTQLAFRTSVIALRAISHPCIQTLYGAHWPDKPGTRAHIVTERKTGRLSDTRLTSLLDNSLRLRILSDVSAAITHIHALRFYHGALSPDVICLRLEDGAMYGRAKLDVTAIVLRASAVQNYQLSGVFAPPEIIRGEGNIHFAADVWSFGMLIAYLYHSDPSRFENSMTAVSAAFARQVPAFVEELLSGMNSSSWLSVARDCLKVDACNRPPMHVVSEAIKRIVDNEGDTIMECVEGGGKNLDTEVQPAATDDACIEEEILDSGNGNSTIFYHGSGQRRSRSVCSDYHNRNAHVSAPSSRVTAPISIVNDGSKTGSDPDNIPALLQRQDEDANTGQQNQVSDARQDSFSRNDLREPTPSLGCPTDHVPDQAMSTVHDKNSTRSSATPVAVGEPQTKAFTETRVGIEAPSKVEMQSRGLESPLPATVSVVKPKHFFGRISPKTGIQLPIIAHSLQEGTQGSHGSQPAASPNEFPTRHISGNEQTKQIAISSIHAPPLVLQPSTDFSHNVCDPSPSAPKTIGNASKCNVIPVVGTPSVDKPMSSPSHVTSLEVSPSSADRRVPSRPLETNSMSRPRSKQTSPPSASVPLSTVSPSPSRLCLTEPILELPHDNANCKDPPEVLVHTQQEAGLEHLADGQSSVAHSSPIELGNSAGEEIHSPEAQLLKPNIGKYPSFAPVAPSTATSHFDAVGSIPRNITTPNFGIKCAEVSVSGGARTDELNRPPEAARVIFPPSTAAPKPVSKSQDSFLFLNGPPTSHVLISQQVSTDKIQTIPGTAPAPTTCISEPSNLSPRTPVTNINNSEKEVPCSRRECPEASGIDLVRNNPGFGLPSSPALILPAGHEPPPAASKRLAETSESHTGTITASTPRTCDPRSDPGNHGFGNPSPSSAFTLPLNDSPVQRNNLCNAEDKEIPNVSSEACDKHLEGFASVHKSNDSPSPNSNSESPDNGPGNDCDVDMSVDPSLPEFEDVSRGTKTNCVEVSKNSGPITESVPNSLVDVNGVKSVPHQVHSVETRNPMSVGCPKSHPHNGQPEVINLVDDDDDETMLERPRHSLRRFRRVVPLSPSSDNDEDTIVMASQRKSGVVASDEARKWNKEGEMHITGKGKPVDFSLAVSLFRRAAKDNCAEAHYNLACCYEFERGLEKDEDQASHHYNQAALLGHVLAQVRMAKLHEKGDTKTDKEAAFYWYNKAKEHSAEAMFKVGEAYENGIGVSKSEEKAVAFYQYAADRGSTDGMVALACLLRDGRGVAIDEQKSLELYQRSAEMGNAMALLTLGKWYKDGGLTKDLKKALACLIRASQLAWSRKGEACLEAGHCYELINGDDQNLERAENFYREAYSLYSGDAAFRLGMLSWKRECWSQASAWWKLAAEMGIHQAFVKLGICAEQGRGMRKSPSEALKYYKKAMNHKCIEAFSRAGLLYEHGCMSKRNVSSEKHKAEAAKYYEAGVEVGCVRSMGLLGQCYLTAFGKKQDIQKGLSLFRKAESKGDTLSITELGDCHRDGIGVARDLKEACRYYEKAANLGYAEAEVRYAECLYYGNGTSKDIQKAMMFVEKAIAHNFPDGHRLKADILIDGRGIPKDVDAALSHYRKAVQLKDPSAMVSLGKLYESGSEGVAKDLHRAFQLYKKAADLKCNVAMNNLGVMYERGLYVRQCYSKAVEWYEKGRACGGTEATCNLADCYMQGNGVTKDVETAFNLYKDAAEGGDHAAMTELGSCYSEGIGVTQDVKRGVDLYEEAHEAGDTEATRRLGVALIDGIGVDQNASRGMTLLAEAIENDNVDALLDKGRFCYIGRGVQKDLSEARKLFQASVQKGNTTAMKYLANMYFKGDGGLPIDRARAFNLYIRSLSDVLGESSEQESPCTSA